MPVDCPVKRNLEASPVEGPVDACVSLFAPCCLVFLPAGWVLVNRLGRTERLVLMTLWLTLRRLQRLGN